MTRVRNHTGLRRSSRQAREAATELRARAKSLRHRSKEIRQLAERLEKRSDQLKEAKRPARRNPCNGGRTRTTRQRN